MVNISRKTFQRKGKEKIVDNDGILWLNEKHLEEGLDHKKFQETTIKSHSDHRNYRYEQVKEPKKQCHGILKTKNKQS